MAKKTKTPTTQPLIVLTSGSHSADCDDVCLVEYVSVELKQTKTDHPAGISSVICAAARCINDGPWGSDQDRTDALMPFVPRIMASTGVDQDLVLTVRLAEISAKMAKSFADSFDPALTPAERIQKNGPILLNSLLVAAGL